MAPREVTCNICAVHQWRCIYCEKACFMSPLMCEEHRHLDRNKVKFTLATEEPTNRHGCDDQILWLRQKGLEGDRNAADEIEAWMWYRNQPKSYFDDTDHSKLTQVGVDAVDRGKKVAMRQLRRIRAYRLKRPGLARKIRAREAELAAYSGSRAVEGGQGVEEPQTRQAGEAVDAEEAEESEATRESEEEESENPGYPPNRVIRFKRGRRELAKPTILSDLLERSERNTISQPIDPDDNFDCRDRALENQSPECAEEDDEEEAAGSSGSVGPSTLAGTAQPAELIHIVDPAKMPEGYFLKRANRRSAFDIHPTFMPSMPGMPSESR